VLFLIKFSYFKIDFELNSEIGCLTTIRLEGFKNILNATTSKCLFPDFYMEEDVQDRNQMLRPHSFLNFIQAAFNPAQDEQTNHTPYDSNTFPSIESNI
jgi:hypothetical protein